MYDFNLQFWMIELYHIKIPGIFPFLFHFCSAFVPFLFRFFCRNPNIQTKSVKFSGYQQEPVDATFNHTRLVQQFLRLQKPVEVAIHRESRELPLDDSREPHQRAHIIKPDWPETLPSIQNFKTSLGEPIHRDLQILVRKWHISLTAEKLYQLPVIFRTHLLGDEQATRFQYPVYLAPS